MSGPIVTATDFSPAALVAAKRALQLAGAQSCGLKLLHVIDGGLIDALRSLLGIEGAAQKDILSARIEGDLEAMALDIAAGSDVAVVCDIRSGPVEREIVACLEETNARLLVIGAHGAGRLRDLPLGSTAVRLLRKTQRPTLIVQTDADAQNTPYQRVLVPVDFSPWSAVCIAAVLALLPHAHITLLHVVALSFEGQLRYAGVSEEVIGTYRHEARHKAFAEMKQLHDSLQLDEERVAFRVVDGDVAPALLTAIHDEKADLVAIGKHGQGVFEDMLLGSVTQHILASAGCDVLVCGRQSS
ncbi:MAG: universal stress protein [Pseudomonadota bacterium]